MSPRKSVHPQVASSLSLLIAVATAAVLVSCAGFGIGGATITADPGNADIEQRLVVHLRELHNLTGLEYKGRTIHIAAPVAGFTKDWRDMPIAKIRGHSQGGLTAWKVLEGHTTVYLAHWKGHIPDWLVRHEALHVILLSHGITGHPQEYSQYFEKPYWWLPEDHFMKKPE
ncbi:MAG: hypothetical protein AAGJ79_11110 [Verrucomicrobiota bacterium]